MTYKCVGCNKITEVIRKPTKFTKKGKKFMYRSACCWKDVVEVVR